jgi:hypothetical protein
MLYGAATARAWSKDHDLSSKPSGTKVPMDSSHRGTNFSGGRSSNQKFVGWSSVRYRARKSAKATPVEAIVSSPLHQCPASRETGARRVQMHPLPREVGKRPRRVNCLCYRLVSAAPHRNSDKEYRKMAQTVRESGIDEPSGATLSKRDDLKLCGQAPHRPCRQWWTSANHCRAERGPIGIKSPKWMIYAPAACWIIVQPRRNDVSTTHTCTAFGCSSRKGEPSSRAVSPLQYCAGAARHRGTSCRPGVKFRLLSRTPMSASD